MDGALIAFLEYIFAFAEVATDGTDFLLLLLIFASSSVDLFGFAVRDLLRFTLMAGTFRGFPDGPGAAVVVGCPAGDVPSPQFFKGLVFFALVGLSATFSDPVSAKGAEKFLFFS